MLHASHSHLAPADAIACGRVLSTVQDAMGEEAFASGLAIGGALTMEQAVAEAFGSAH